ncbi:uncharacterized protein FTJAE_12524 [Fusarium tjaetaba]|uniref:Uncharacterized protein n=1 Tax=Fusarium tjaetaba TaxID=1567544 RepID=A0A8H5VE01_9HYPO|nr:uncharacterized protein FTJAE_12524 [Fusarium tjaetaba]KAF5617734.1 hypothetical protein FTJAE_12524 [Fusarium tjaetaba]
MSANQTNFTATPIPGGFAGVASDPSDIREFAMRAMQESGAPGFLVQSRMTICSNIWMTSIVAEFLGTSSDPGSPLNNPSRRHIRPSANKAIHCSHTYVRSLYGACIAQRGDGFLPTGPDRPSTDGGTARCRLYCLQTSTADPVVVMAHSSVQPPERGSIMWSHIDHISDAFADFFVDFHKRSNATRGRPRAQVAHIKVPSYSLEISIAEGVQQMFSEESSFPDDTSIKATTYGNLLKDNHSNFDLGNKEHTPTTWRVVYHI